MFKIFISQPMSGKSKEQISSEREKAINTIQQKYINKQIEILDSLIEEEAPGSLTPDMKSLWYLGKSFELLATADIVYFVKGWEAARGCEMEYMAAMYYGIDVVLEAVNGTTNEDSISAQVSGLEP